MVIFVFLLDFFDFWLDNLELLLACQHVMLWNEENKSNNKRNNKDGPSESMSRKEYEKSNKKVVNRVVEDIRQKCPNRTRS